MNVSLDEYWEKFMEAAIRSGRYNSPEDVVHEGLRLVEERETRLRALRETLHVTTAEGGEINENEVDRELIAAAESLTPEDR